MDKLEQEIKSFCFQAPRWMQIELQAFWYGFLCWSLTCAEEYDLNMNLLSKGALLGYCNSTLYLYRRHDEQKSLGKGIDQNARAIKIQAIKDRYQ